MLETAAQGAHPRVPKRRRLSKRQRNWILGALLVAFVVGTLAGVPIGTKPRPTVRIPLPYITVGAAFAPLDHTGVVPSNIFAATVVPRSAVVTGRENLDNDNGPFDRSVTFQVPLAANSLITFEKAALVHFGWRTSQRTYSKGVTTFYAVKAGNDGNYWEVAASIGPAAVRSLSSANAQNVSQISVRLLRQSFS
ncbi:MAG: hypothetical protein M0Z47_02695 [Actinomycetota bacterium]|nr:hypothetical protein [Actinomycetota bacterium]